METTIEVEGEEKKARLYLSTDYLVNDNYVELNINGGEEFTVPLDELVSSVQSFQHLRDLRIEREA